MGNIRGYGSNLSPLEEIINTIELTDQQGRAISEFISKYLMEWKQQMSDSIALNVAVEFLRIMPDNQKIFELKEGRIRDIEKYLRGDREFMNKYGPLF